jgi:hypothetical protein
MKIQPLRQMSAGLIVLLAVIALAVVTDAVVIAIHLRAGIRALPPPSAQAETKQPGQHPCNHGFYVSQAAHAKKGGGYVSQVAKGSLGKNGVCSAPLPAPAATAKDSTEPGDDQG